MSKVPESSSRPANCPLTAAGFQTDAETERAPLWAEVNKWDLEPCLQDLDPSGSAAGSGVGDCNLECCHCAIRWYARRFLRTEEN